MAIGMKKTNDDQIIGFLGREISLSGRLHFNGAVRIDGKYEGEIDAEGRLIVGDEAVVIANIRVDEALVMGVVKGTIDARGRLEIRSQGKVFGDIKTPKLIIHDGAIFEGQCIMEGKKELSLLVENDLVEIENTAEKAVSA